MRVDFNKNINEQWREQTTTTSHTAATADEKVLATSTFNTEIPSTVIDIYNFPRKSKSIVATSKNKEKLIELFDLIESKNETTLKFNESEDLFVSEEFKHFKEVQFDIFPLRIFSQYETDFLNSYFNRFFNKPFKSIMTFWRRNTNMNIVIRTSNIFITINYF